MHNPDSVREPGAIDNPEFAPVETDSCRGTGRSRTGPKYGSSRARSRPPRYDIMKPPPNSGGGFCRHLWSCSPPGAVDHRRWPFLAGKERDHRLFVAHPVNGPHLLCRPCRAGKVSRSNYDFVVRQTDIESPFSVLMVKLNQYSPS